MRTDILVLRHYANCIRIIITKNIMEINTILIFLNLILQN